MYWIKKQYPIFVQIQYVNKEYDISVGLSFANVKLVQLAIFFWKCKICRITRFYDKTKPKGQTDVLKKIKWRWSEVFFIAMVVHCIPNCFHPFYYFTWWTLWIFGNQSPRSVSIVRWKYFHGQWFKFLLCPPNLHWVAATSIVPYVQF